MHLGIEHPAEQQFEQDGIDPVEAGCGWRGPEAQVKACDAARSITQ